MKKITFELPPVFVMMEKSKRERLKDINDKEPEDYSDNILSQNKKIKIKGL